MIERFAGWTWFVVRLVLSLLMAQVEAVTAPAMDELRRIAGKNDQTAIVYMVFLMMVVGFAAAFFLIRYVLNHAREIHSESNRTLLDISSKHETRCDKLTTTFSTECAQLRQMMLRITGDARDMVHAARDIAQSSINGKEFVELYQKKEAELKANRDRESHP